MEADTSAPICSKTCDSLAIIKQLYEFEREKSGILEYMSSRKIIKDTIKSVIDSMHISHYYYLSWKLLNRFLIINCWILFVNGK